MRMRPKYLRQKSNENKLEIDLNRVGTIGQNSNHMASNVSLCKRKINDIVIYVYKYRVYTYVIL